MLLYISAILIILLCWFFLRKAPRHDNTPPGPKGLPILGIFLDVKPTSHQYFTKLKETYGDVFSVDMCQLRCIVLTSYSAIKEALVTKGENFSGRPNNKFFDMVNKRSGIVFIDGPIWQEHRRYSLQVLRDFGFGKNLSEEIINNEADRLINYLDSLEGTSCDSISFLTRAVSNVICTITLGEQPGYDPDDECAKVTKGIQNAAHTPLFFEPLCMFPQLIYIAPLLMRLPAIQERLDSINNLHSYIDEKIKKHRDTLEGISEPRDFTDAYLLEQQRLDKTETHHTFSDWQIMRVIMELFAAGTDTTTNSLAWSFLFMALKPDIQRKVRKEIDEKLGNSGHISYKQRNVLPYVQAVLDETLRITSIITSSVPHRNFKTDTIQGLTIPANSYILPCIYAVHHDPNIWEKPEEFYPEHFLTENGEYRNRQEFFPFSIGRRACLGESLARMEYFIFFISMIRRYSISLDEESKKIANLNEGCEGVISSPKKHKIVFKRIN